MSHSHLCTLCHPNLTIRPVGLAFAAQLLFCCIAHYKLNDIRVIVSTPLQQCSPAVLCYWGSNCTISLCFTLCAQPYITPAYAHCALLRPQEVCIMLCNLPEKFMVLYHIETISPLRYIFHVRDISTSLKHSGLPGHAPQLIYKTAVQTWNWWSFDLHLCKCVWLIVWYLCVVLHDGVCMAVVSACGSLSPQPPRCLSPSPSLTYKAIRSCNARVANSWPFFCDPTLISLSQSGTLVEKLFGIEDPIADTRKDKTWRDNRSSWGAPSV